MLHEPARHEPVCSTPWDASAAQAMIQRIVADTEANFDAQRYWPMHPLDRYGDEAPDQVETPLYHGACGVIWALHYLRDLGMASLSCDHGATVQNLLQRNRVWLGTRAETERASFLMGDTPIRLLTCGLHPSDDNVAELQTLIAGNTDHPARELMWGAPGTLLAAWFLFERSGETCWADLFRLTADKLWSQLEWSDEFACAYLPQRMFGRTSAYLDAVHGFIGMAVPLIHGRQLLSPERWAAWQSCISNTVQRTADQRGDQANWRVQLHREADPKKLVQLCHGAPGFVICLADMPGTDLDALLIAAGELIWAAGPLIKGSNLCHGTGGNGYAFLKLYQRTGDPLWLARARAFAMHGIAQTETDQLRYGQMRYSLWTGDLGFAIYLADCLREQAQFPTLDVFYAGVGHSK